jgi:hypothetical protein
MDKETFNASLELVTGVGDDVRFFLYGEEDKGFKDTFEILEEINDAISELESWKKVIKNGK